MVVVIVVIADAEKRNDSEPQKHFSLLQISYLKDVCHIKL